MSLSTHCTYTMSSIEQPDASAAAATLCQASSASSSNVPGANLPPGPSAGIPLMKQSPEAARVRLKGKPAGRPAPGLVRLMLTRELLRKSDCGVSGACLDSYRGWSRGTSGHAG